MIHYNFNGVTTLYINDNGLFNLRSLLGVKG